MKRILVIDESEVIRETLALVLGQEFVVVTRPLEKRGVWFTDAGNDVDLLILGVTPGIGLETSSLLRFASQVPYAVLFLVDSKSVARAIEDRDKVGCLSKPFHPFELREKVGRLLTRQAALPETTNPSAEGKRQDYAWALEFPYLSRTVASLVHRFAATSLPLLICGEIGCGQRHVARAIAALGESFVPLVSLNGAEVSSEYLAQKSREISFNADRGEKGLNLMIENIETLSESGQFFLQNFLEEAPAAGTCRLVTTARANLLERVYQGSFLEVLYYKIATLTLTLPPLRDRRDDVPAVASWFAQRYARDLGLGQVTFSAGAKDRLCNYLWFGNLSEMDTVIARTLVAHRKTAIEATDLIFDFTGSGQAIVQSEFDEYVPPKSYTVETPTVAKTAGTQHNGLAPLPKSGNGYGKSLELKVLIHELAHELKNPMVTIKTFAQLLGDRYQDEHFRARFRDVVGGDIERMDDLLEVLLEFADFSQPRSTRIPLTERLQAAVKEVDHECTKKQALIRWKGNSDQREILADEGQLNYVLKNVLLTVLSRARVRSEIEIDVGRKGSVAISYLRDGERVGPITHHLSLPPHSPEEALLPLRILLAKQLVERNGGGITIDQADNERDILRMEFPIA